MSDFEEVRKNDLDGWGRAALDRIEAEVERLRALPLGEEAIVHRDRRGIVSLEQPVSRVVAMSGALLQEMVDEANERTREVERLRAELEKALVEGEERVAEALAERGYVRLQKENDELAMENILLADFGALTAEAATERSDLEAEVERLRAIEKTARQHIALMDGLNIALRLEPSVTELRNALAEEKE